MHDIPLGMARGKGGGAEWRLERRNGDICNRVNNKNKVKNHIIKKTLKQELNNRPILCPVSKSHRCVVFFFLRKIAWIDYIKILIVISKLY